MLTPAELCTLLLFSAAFQLGAVADEDQFAKELMQLRSRPLQDIGREAFTTSHETFIQRYADDPRVAEAMFDLGASFENVAPKLGIQSDHALAKKWIRDAASTAEAGSPIWLRAQFHLVGHSEDPNEMRRFLDAIQEYSHEDIETLANSNITRCWRR